MSAFLWGLGLRPHHFSQLGALDAHPAVPCLEARVEDLVFHRGGPALHHVSRLAPRADAFFLHGASMNVGGGDPLDPRYLAGLKALCDRLSPALVSDHLCFTRHHHFQSYGLLPIVRDARSLAWVCERVEDIQCALGRPFGLENISSPLAFRDDTLAEGEFLAEVARRTGCRVVLNVSAVSDAAQRAAAAPHEILGGFDFDSVAQLHVTVRGETVPTLSQGDAACLEECRIRLCGRKVPFIVECDDRRVGLASLRAFIEQETSYRATSADLTGQAGKEGT